MKNKVLVEVFIPSLDEEYDIYIPLNKNIANIIELICKSINDMKRTNSLEVNDFSLYNRETGLKYQPEFIIKETNIRNGFRLLMM